jgi:hypothetical protein
LDCEPRDRRLAPASTGAAYGDPASAAPLRIDRLDLDASNVVNREGVCRVPEELERSNSDPHPIAATTQPKQIAVKD